MEIMAAIMGLDALKVPCSVTIVTDSKYVMHAFTKGWLARWTRNGWKTSDGRKVRNVDLWQRLQPLYVKHEVEWKWVRGHSGDAENERCDQLVVNARRQMRRSPAISARSTQPGPSGPPPRN